MYTLAANILVLEAALARQAAIMKAMPTYTWAQALRYF
jgi:hypothetical protein